MNSTDSADVDKLLDTLNAQSHAKKLQAWALICLSVALLAAVAIVAVQTKTTSDRSEKTTRQISSLSHDLDVAHLEVAASQRVDLARETCRLRLVTNVERAASRQQGAVANLVVIIATTPIDERQAAVAMAVKTLDAARLAYTAALDLEASYTPELPAEPCPIGG